jgi:outer membrane protein W
MKSLFRSFLVVVAVGLFTAAQAQFQLGANFNGVAPVSPTSISDAYDFGFGGTLIARYGINENIRLGLDVGYYSHSAKIGSGTATFLPINAIFEYSFTTEGFMPYIGLGAGVTSTTVNQEFTIFGFTSSVEATSTNFNVAPVLGFRYGLSDNLDLDFNVKYNAIFSDGDATGLVPIGLGLVYKFNN